jgi:carboxymethylenebutenolidase
VDLHCEWVGYSSEGGPARAYLARPAAARRPVPGLVVIQEMWGVDAHIEDVTRRYAEAGYAALAPDLFARGGARPAPLAPERILAFRGFIDANPGVWGGGAAAQAALDRLPESERGRIAETQQALGAARDPGAHLGTLRAGAAWLRAQPLCAGRAVGSVGYCMGGGLSALLAASDAGLSAAVIYYGASLGADRVAAVTCPILGIYGEADARITSTVPAFAEAMRAAGKAFEHHVYPGAQHAFFNDERPAYDAEAARLAWARTLAFFAERLT